MFKKPRHRGGHQGRGRGRAAFTLIELLVVVAIIALLISILLPSLSRARATARIVQCQAMMKQYANANEMYADANVQFYVPIKTPHPTWTSWVSFQPFRPFLAVPLTGKLPVELTCADMDPFYRVTLNRPWGQGYGFNNQSSGQGYNPGICLARSKIPLPSMKAQLTESNYWRQDRDGAQAGPNWDTWRETMPADGGNPSYPTLAYRHIEQTNIQYFDSHVSVLTKAEAYPANSTNRRRLWELLYK